MNINCFFNTNRIDHYAVHVLDIEKSKQFHIDCLGFKFVKTYTFKTSHKSDTDDTISIVLKKLTNNESVICVLNAPLNEFSFLQQAINLYGEGIHHIAYEVSNIEEEVAKGKKNNIVFTSKDIIIDHANSLKQIFIDKQYTGYFLELIERSVSSSELNNDFSQENIRDLMLSVSQDI